MIWFTCKQCGKRHGRADNLVGTLVFCECGHGNRVPWASTTAEPEVPEAEVLPPRPAPPPPPAPEERRPERQRPFPPLTRGRVEEDEDDRPPSRPWERAGEGLPEPKRRPPELRRVRPNFCYHHDEVASEHTCAECRLPFCSACVVTLQGRTLCGPCKNFHLSGLSRPPRVVPYAVVALVLGLVSGPVTLVLTFFAVGLHMHQGTAAAGVLLCLLSLILPGSALVLAWLGLRQIETQAQAGGRALATSGGSIALVGVLWSLTVALLLVGKHWQG
jgi:hypothetical protein